MDRRTAREEAFKVLFQQGINKVENLSYDKMNAYTKLVVSGVIEHLEEIDQKIEKSLRNWTFDRIALVEKTILRISVFELTYLDDIPVGVSINEAVELAHTYGDDKSGKFVNGVLSKVIDEKEA